MPKGFECPFFNWQQPTQRIVHCECAELRFPDREARDRYINRFCSNQPGWQRCPLAVEMEKFYERKDARNYESQKKL